MEKEIESDLEVATQTQKKSARCPRTRGPKNQVLPEVAKCQYFSKRNRCGNPPFVLSGKTVTWIPPKSPYNLIQESLYHDPWKLLVATIFLNRTSGREAIDLLMQFFERWPSPKELLEAPVEDVGLHLQPIGLHMRRANNIKRFTEEYLTHNWREPIELFGIGKYGNDTYRIFCTGEWRKVKPRDKMLNLYHQWLFHHFDEENRKS